MFKALYSKEMALILPNGSDIINVQPTETLQNWNSDIFTCLTPYDTQL